MRTINKGSEPCSLTTWKRKNSHKYYKDLDPSIRQEIREYALKEQFYLCAYCCQRIEDIDTCHNEGLEDEEVLKLLIDVLIDERANPKQGKLDPFAPVVINILHNPS